MLFNPNWHHKPEWARIVLQAADIIEREGFCRRVMFDGHGYCILGAIRLALVGHPEPMRLYAAIAERLYLVIGHRSIATWNDTHSAAAAIALLRLAAS